MNIPDHNSKSLETMLGKKILKFFDADPGSGINFPDPQHWRYREQISSNQRNDNIVLIGIGA
jgi:hypothetical protein